MPIYTKPARIFKTTIEHFTRNTSHSVTAVIVMSLTLILISFFILLILGMNTVLSHFEAKPQVTAFFKDEATEDEIMAIKDRLLNTGEVKEVTFISKEDALNRYKEQNKNEPILLEMVTSKILPASLEISANDIVYLGHLASLLENETLVEDVYYQQDVVQTLERWTNALRLGGTAVVGIFALVSVLIVIITISTNISHRKEEIEIMRLVGASASYIRWPFILEGITYGLISGLISIGVIYVLLPKLTPAISNFLAGIPLFPVPSIVFVRLLIANTALGIFMGVVGSTIAIYKGLKR